MARYRETRSIALTIAAGISLIVLLLVLLQQYLQLHFEWWYLLVSLPLIFWGSYWLVQEFLDQFIYKKIKLVYKTIQSLKPSKRKGIIKNQESLEGVNQAVLEWSARQRTEIEELKKLAVYRREFLGNISHELKTPIFNIQGYILTLLDGGLEDESINRQYLMRTEKSINRLIAIIEDLEEISKLESGELKLNKQRFDLAELTRDVIEFLEMKARKHKAKVFLEKHPEKHVFVEADKKRIRQVLINLIENAVKYGDKEENKVTIRIFDMDDNYLIEIKDNGPGIAEESLPRIFERFYRVDKGRSRDTGGSGLGLAIVKHIIEAHEQTITVRSKIGQGTTFSFTLQK
jgi:two-component system phosphate regulon sensor histidine kinase PhoR